MLNTIASEAPVTEVGDEGVMIDTPGPQCFANLEKSVGSWFSTSCSVHQSIIDGA